MIYLVVTITCLVVVVAYIRLARKLSWVDQPNHRSSHTKPTIVGGGIVIPVVFAGFVLYAYPLHWPLAVAVLSLSAISFKDDISGLSPLVRLMAQFLSVGMIIYGLIGPIEVSTILISSAVLLIYVYWINAFNFMDGINGIAVSYGLVTLGTLWYINENLVAFAPKQLILVTLISCLAFAFFNFRNRAVCFAGDVGSISLALILGYFMLTLVIASSDWTYLILFYVFFLDSASTILERIVKKQALHKPHRLHLYQLLANEKGMAHLSISTIYAVLQLIINVLFLWQLSSLSPISGFILLSLLILFPALLYFILKINVFQVFKQ